MLIDNDWLEVLSGEFKKPYYASLYRFLKEEYTTKVIYPPSADIFNALHLTPLHSVRVVILGQDPYHEKHQAHGLAFSVQKGERIPPSLMNIFRELNEDVGTYIPDNGCLIKWASQGVLLLNTLLTVREHQAMSHKGAGWEQFTDAVVDGVIKQDRPIVFMLWGRAARDKAARVRNYPLHMVLEAAHPSPLSASGGFFGCRHFSRCNEFLIRNNMDPIDWQIENLKEDHSQD